MTMTTSITFDTLKFVETLKASGFDDTQAKGITTAFRDAQAAQSEEIATKQELRELASQLASKADMARVELHIQELRQDMKELEIRLIKWMVGTSGILFALIKFLPGSH